ncbi:hypothetical protein C7974DRAFT_381638, partial [Boeremia exigua]|uniref:uncharacterized protein n=1 Tax=Boeremia exigua TaxID=749465 RepID=UPI001E8DC8F5
MAAWQNSRPPSGAIAYDRRQRFALPRGEQPRAALCCTLPLHMLHKAILLSPDITVPLAAGRGPTATRTILDTALGACAAAAILTLLRAQRPAPSTLNHASSTDDDAAHGMDTALRATVEKDEQRRPSPMTTPTRRPEVEELSPVTRPGPAKAATTIISAVPAPTMMITTDPIGAAEVLGAFDDHPDDRS